MRLRPCGPCVAKWPPAGARGLPRHGSARRSALVALCPPRFARHRGGIASSVPWCWHHENMGACVRWICLSQYVLPGGARSSERLELAPRDSAPAARDRSPAVDPRVLGKGFSPADGPLDAATGLCRVSLGPRLLVDAPSRCSEGTEVSDGSSPVVFAALAARYSWEGLLGQPIGHSVAPGVGLGAGPQGRSKVGGDMGFNLAAFHWDPPREQVPPAPSHKGPFIPRVSGCVLRD